MKKTFTLFLALIFSLSLWSQQSSQYSLYMHNPYAFNAAYAGMANSLNMVGVYRNQWINIAGSPESQNVSVHLPVYYFGGGLGMNINNVNWGAHRNTRATLSYSYHLPLGKNKVLGIGLSGGLVQQAYNGAELRAPEGVYNENTGINHNDNFLPINNVSALAPTFGIGVYYKGEGFEAALSADNLLESRLVYDLPNTTTEISLRRHFYAYATYHLLLGEVWKLSPSILAKSDISETQIEFSAIIKYNNNIFVGASFRGYTSNTTDAVVLLAGLKVNKNLTLGYAYDIGLSPLKTVHTGSHEITLNYNLNKAIGMGIPPKIIYNPRTL